MSNRIQSKLLTLCFQLVRDREIEVFLRLRQQSEKDMLYVGRNYRLPLTNGQPKRQCLVCGTEKNLTGDKKSRLCKEHYQQRRRVADRISEHHRRLCFHWLRDHEPERLERLRRIAQREVLYG